MPPYLEIAVTIAYTLFLLYTIVCILLDTHSNAKTLAYLLLVIAFPVAGMIFYYAFGINYRHKKVTARGIASLKQFSEAFRKYVPDDTRETLKANAAALGQYTELAEFIYKVGGENLTRNNFKLLLNGEVKFPEVLRTLETARVFIHMEYYDWENDTRGNQIKEVLLRKTLEGVKVRVIYDEYASRKIKKNIVKELKNGGIEIFPALKVKLGRLASGLNHRDHRKVIIVDGLMGFVGGINVSDRYDNSIDTGLYWRDTHVKITGPAVLNLQRHFVINWNALQPDTLQFDQALFPGDKLNKATDEAELAQIVSGGPIYPMSNIMLTYFRIFSLAKERLYITNPYFIPSDSILDALKEASISGTDVRLLLPLVSDSAIVALASQFYFRELLEAGVRIYRYKKGFVHAKTVVADSFVSVVGTANMDIRSFDLNFEIMAVIYGKHFGRQLEEAYLEDLKECKELTLEEWNKNSKGKKLMIAVARLISEFL